MLPTRRKVMALGAAAALNTAPGLVHAQQRLMRVIVTFPPGGIVDILARVLQAPLEKQLGETVLLDTKPGAGGVIGTAEMARAKPDGQTLAMVYDTHAVNHYLVKGMPYDTFALRSIGLLAMAPTVLVTGPDFLGSTLADVIKAAKAKNGGFSFGNVGVGSSNQLTAALFADSAKLKIIDVAYRGAGPMVTDIIGGQVDAAFASLTAALPHIRSKRLKLIATCSPERLKEFPAAETVAETFRGFRASAWVALVGPAGLAPRVVAQLNDAVNKALASPELAGRLAQFGLVPAPGTPDDFDRMLRQESTRWGKVIRELKIESQ